MACIVSRCGVVQELKVVFTVCVVLVEGGEHLLSIGRIGSHAKGELVVVRDRLFELLIEHWILKVVLYLPFFQWT